MSEIFRDFEGNDDPDQADLFDGDSHDGRGFDRVCEFDVTSLEDQMYSLDADMDVPSGVTLSHSPEECLRAAAAEPPRPRTGLRQEFLSEVAAIESSLERLSRLPAVVACLLAVCAGHFRPAERPAAVGSRVLTMHAETLPMAAGLLIDIPRRMFRVAGHDNTDWCDDWNLVDACHDRRAWQSFRLQRSQGQGSKHPD